MQSEGIRWYNRTMETASTVLQKQRRSGDVNVETVVRVLPFCEGFLVEQTSLVKRAHDGALLHTDGCSWHLDGDDDRRALVRKLEDNGFQVTAGTPLLERVASAVFGWLN